jgi:hypothetical protein
MGTAKGFISVTLIVYIVLFAVIAGMAWYIRGAIAERDTLRAEKKAAQARATYLANLWADSIQKVEVKGKEEDRKNADTFAPLVARAAGVHPAAVVVSPAVARLFADSDAAARAATASPISNGPAPAETPVPEGQALAYDERELAEWKVADDAAYVSVFSKWRRCVDTYNELRLQETLH